MNTFNEKDKIVIKNNDEEKVFYKLLKFSSDKTNKEYLIYCDENKKIYSSILAKIDDKIKFLPIEDDLDKMIVQQAMNIVQIKFSN